MSRRIEVTAISDVSERCATDRCSRCDFHDRRTRQRIWSLSMSGQTLLKHPRTHLWWKCARRGLSVAAGKVKAMLTIVLLTSFDVHVVTCIIEGGGGTRQCRTVGHCAVDSDTLGISALNALCVQIIARVRAYISGAINFCRPKCGRDTIEIKLIVS